MIRVRVKFRARVRIEVRVSVNNNNLTAGKLTDKYHSAAPANGRHLTWVALPSHIHAGFSSSTYCVERHIQI